jgi:hypothetical protein
MLSYRQLICQEVGMTAPIARLSSPALFEAVAEGGAHMGDVVSILSMLKSASVGE